MNTNSLNMSLDYKKFIKTIKLTTMDNIMLAFSKCATIGDVEDVCFGKYRPNETAFGEFELVDYDDKTFTVAQTYYDPEKGKEVKLPYTFHFAEVGEHEFTFDVTGNFTRRVKVRAVSEEDAEELLYVALENARVLRQDVADSVVETEGDIYFDDISFGVSEIN